MSKNKRMRQARRDAFDIASDPRSLLLPFDPTWSGRLSEAEDHRTFHPGSRKPRTVRQAAKYVAPKARPGRTLTTLALAFQAPESTLVCVRRKIRKEVIHAKGKAGGAVKKPRRNRFSSVSCKR